MQTPAHKLHQFQSRKIEFNRCHQVGDWRVKVYTITKNSKFESNEILESAIDSLATWVKDAEARQLDTYKISTLIAHEGREGVWLLFSWWMDGEMIETRVRLGEYGSPPVISDSPLSHSVVCVWELEIFIHERQAWIEHVLMKAEQPDFEGYLADVL